MKTDLSASPQLAASITAWLTLLVLPFVYFAGEQHAVLLLEIFAAAGFSACCVFFYRGRIKLTPAGAGIVTLLSVWLFLAGRSVLISVDPSSSLPAFIKAAALAMLFAVITATLAATRDFTAFFRVATWVGGLHGLLAIQEFIEAPPIPATWLDPASRSFFRTRCAGIFTDPNIFAAFLAVLFIFTLGALLKSSNRFERLSAGLSLILCGTAILTTLSRGGWIGLSVGLLLLAILCNRNRISVSRSVRQIMLGATIVLLAIFLLGPFKMRFFSIGNPADMTFAQRTLINKGIFRSLSRFPVVGHGLHTFNQVYPRYRIVGGDYPMNAHNEFIHSLMETGFLSAIILMALCLRLLWLGTRKDKIFACERPVFVAGFATLVIQNLSGFSSRILPTAVLLAICAGGIAAFSVIIAEQPSHAKNRSRFLAVLLTFLTAVSFWNGFQTFFTQTNLMKAQQALRTGHPEEATELLETLLKKEPCNSHIYAALATAFAMTARLEEARHAWEKAAALNGGEALFFVHLARLSEKKDPSTAEQYFQQALLLDPAAENFRLEFAAFLLRQARKSEALAQLQIGLAYSPGFHNVYKGFHNMEKLRDQLLHTNP